MPSHLLPTSVVGSHGLPGWVWLAREALEAGRLGVLDLRELTEDATQVALLDQERAGVDVLTTGEMTRVRFIIGFYDRFTGIRTLEAPRKLGQPLWDTNTPFEVFEKLGAPQGLGIVEEFELARRLTDRPLKATVPGPYTLMVPLRLAGGYKDKSTLLADLVAIVNAECRALAAAGADFIQIDEPSPAIHPDAPADFAALFNPVVAGVPAGVRLAAHLCFGNYMGRPLAKRTYRPVLDQLRRFAVHELVLEFANREMAELEVLAELTDRFDIAAGVIDVKNSYVESAYDVAERIDRILEYVPADRLSLVPDCGFSQTARGVTRPKLRSLVAGRDLVRDRARP